MSKIGQEFAVSVVSLELSTKTSAFSQEGFVQDGRGGGGFFRCGRSHLLMQKNFDFLKFMM